jgi:hypothetical protein
MGNSWNVFNDGSFYTLTNLSKSGKNSYHKPSNYNFKKNNNNYKYKGHYSNDKIVYNLFYEKVK